MKKVVTVCTSKRLKKSSDAGATLEAHQSTSSSNDVREHTGIFTSTLRVCISSLEAELEASRKAFDAATTAMVNAEKSTKSALAKVKKAEKALTHANKEHLQRE
jgi:hypothetical protein